MPEEEMEHNNELVNSLSIGYNKEDDLFLLEMNNAITLVMTPHMLIDFLQEATLLVDKVARDIFMSSMDPFFGYSHKKADAKPIEEADKEKAIQFVTELFEANNNGPIAS